VFTLTEYNKNPQKDLALLNLLEKHYAHLYFWPQSFGDVSYVRELVGNRCRVLPPDLEALDACCRRKGLIMFGTRLHAGIRALQHACRTIIVAVDNRATEMGRDFNLPVIQRADIEARLKNLLTSQWPTDVRLDFEAIRSWRSQFP